MLDEPDGADYQYRLAGFYDGMGDLLGALGRGDEARETFAKALVIMERLAEHEPDRTDYQRGLSVSYGRIGRLFLDVGQQEEGRRAIAKAFVITERLAQAEPSRADYQRDLITLSVNMSEIEPAKRHEYLSNALDIARRLWDTGRLAPLDLWIVDDLARRMAGLNGGTNVGVRSPR